jgi:hypothetical protein
MFNSVISKLSNEKYDIIADDILNKLEISPFSGGNNTNDDKIFLIHLTNTFLCKSSYGKYYNFKYLESFFFFFDLIKLTLWHYRTIT